MIIMGAGTNHWYHSDEITGSMLARPALRLPGQERTRRLGPLRGQEKVRPITGWTTIAFAFDWARPTRHMAGTALWYLASSQWRYDTFKADEFATPLGNGLLAGKHMADCLAMSARLGWLPSSRASTATPGESAEAEREGIDVKDYVVRAQGGRLRRRRGPSIARVLPARPHPGAVICWARQGSRVLPQAPARRPGRRRKSRRVPEEMRPEEVVWRDAPEGKLDLLTTIDFRTGRRSYSDIVLPTATWYEKHDISSTDMHPFIHPFNPAITPPWRPRATGTSSTTSPTSSRVRQTHLGVRKDVLVVPSCTTRPTTSPSPEERCSTGKRRVRARPRQDDAEARGDRTRLRRGRREDAGARSRCGERRHQYGEGEPLKPAQEVDYLKRRNGTVRRGVGAVAGRSSPGRAGLRGDPGSLGHDQRAALGRGLHAAGEAHRDEARGSRRRAGRFITFADITSQPRKVIVSPEWSVPRAAPAAVTPRSP